MYTCIVYLRNKSRSYNVFWVLTWVQVLILKGTFFSAFIFVLFIVYLNIILTKQDMSCLYWFALFSFPCVCFLLLSCTFLNHNCRAINVLKCKESWIILEIVLVKSNRSMKILNARTKIQKSIGVIRIRNSNDRQHKGQKEKGQIAIYKALHSKLKIE
jgi:hypothetical protein